MAPSLQRVRHAIIHTGFIEVPLPDLYELTSMVTHNTATRMVLMKPDPKLGMGIVFHTISEAWLRKANDLRQKHPGIRIYVVNRDVYRLISDEVSVTQILALVNSNDEWDPPAQEDTTCPSNLSERLFLGEEENYTTGGNENATEEQTVISVSSGTTSSTPPSPLRSTHNSDDLPDLRMPSTSTIWNPNNGHQTSTVLATAQIPTTVQPSATNATRQPAVAADRHEYDRPCTLVRGEQSFLLSYARAGANMVLEGCSLSVETFTVPLPDPIPILDPQVPQRDADKVRAMVSELLLMAQAYTEGSLPVYPIAIGNTTSKPARAFFTGEHESWAKNELQKSSATQLQGASYIRDIATRFSEKFNIQPMHPFTLFTRAPHRKHCAAMRFCRYATDSQMVSALSALIRIFDIIHHGQCPREVKKECWFTVKDLRLCEWANLIGMYIFDHWGAMLAFQSFGDKFKTYYKAAFPITNQPPEVTTSNVIKQEMCSTLKSHRFGTKLLACRAAGGTRPTGNMLKTDSDTLECRARIAPPLTISPEEISKSTWIVFCFHATGSDRKRKRPQVKLENRPGEPQAQLIDILSVFENGNTIPLDQTMVLRGKTTSTGNPVGDTAPIEAIWKQGISYVYPAFEGAIVSRAAYRHLEDGETELCLSFASREHYTTACLLFPLWLPHLHFEKTPRYVYAEATAGLHPLSALKATATESGCTMPFQVQRAFLHPNNEFMPDSVLVSKLSGQDFEAKITFPSVAATKEMIGKTVITYGVGSWPYRAIRRTEPLQVFFNPTPIEYCDKCGALGHLAVRCKAPPRMDGTQCSMCTKLGQSHAKTDPCPLRNAFNGNALRTLRLAVENATTTGIFANQHSEILRALFGDTSMIPTQLV
ncbi:uncharacterized protein UTRI_04782 [Ustilago trichophora]|uniref:CCHC-type domain-containing protein n=1 Tax=Ustilago trichophora TaxID=86804 RepID=A0A5C3EEE2_9BASI|nr:uncharacterized protein UTRI_04782 [Ustilago trichophora]